MGVLKAAGLSSPQAFAGGRAWFRDAERAVERAAEPVLLLVPSSTMGRPQLDLVERVDARSGVTLAWVTATLEAGSVGDERITERLLEQRGALTDPRLRVLVEVARVVSACGLDGVAGVHLGRRGGALGTRLDAALRNQGVRPSRGRGRRLATVTVDEQGTIAVAAGVGARVRLSDAETAASALALLTKHRSAPRSGPPTLAEPDREVVDLIARPPARLLSETASKRLLAAYGIDSGPERLCDSPTDAARFWAETGGPVVLKLVRPGLESKEAIDAVVPHVDGAAAVRRAYHTLQNLAAALGPPDPLGVLVAARIDHGARIWVGSSEHPRFGRLVIGGPGDRPAAQPAIALSPPIDPCAAETALASAGLEAAPEAIAALAVALVRFGHMVRELDRRVARAEIHPLVVPEGADRALALDALIAIAD